MKKTYTTFDIAEILDVYPTTVAKWIDEGKIEAFVTPGGHRRVTRDKLIEYLKANNIPIPEEVEKPTKFKILIVEDEKELLETLYSYLTSIKEDYDIEKAMDGFEAGQKFNEFMPDIVILDLKLPGVDGFKICKTIKEKAPNTKIIATTAYSPSVNKAKILKAGADYFIEKKDLMNSIDVYLKKIERFLSHKFKSKKVAKGWKRKKRGLR